MVLTINISNDLVSLGVFQRDNLRFSFSFSRSNGTTADEFCLLFKLIFSNNNINLNDINGCCISSVVPNTLVVISKSVEMLFSVKPYIVGNGIKTGVNIRIDNHSQLGSDLVANVAGCHNIFNSSYIIVDFGIATTLSYVNDNKEFIGVIIAPGVNTSAIALSNSAAALPDISISTPKCLIGKNTFDSMVSGCIYGSACMVDGLIERIKNESNLKHVDLVSTGTYASNITQFCKNEFRYIPHLTLNGLKNIYYLNKDNI